MRIQVERLVDNETNVIAWVNIITGDERVHRSVSIGDVDLSITTGEEVLDLIKANIDRTQLENEVLQIKRNKQKTFIPEGGNFRKQLQTQDWEVGVDYVENQVVVFNSKIYRVVLAHTSQTDWNPEQTAALFTSIFFFEDEFAPWQQPQGAHDAYPLDAQVSHNFKIWKSLINDNVWEPGTDATLWEDIGDLPKDIESGSDSIINTTAQGAGNKSITNTTDISVDIITEGSGSALVPNEGGSNTTVSILSEGSGEANLVISGGSNATISILTEGVGTVPADNTLDEWAAGVAYAVNDEVVYQEISYICIQGHTSQVGWEPPNVPSLWSVI